MRGVPGREAGAGRRGQGPLLPEEWERACPEQQREKARRAAGTIMGTTAGEGHPPVRPRPHVRSRTMSDATCDRCKQPIDPEADDTQKVYETIPAGDISSTWNKTMDVVVALRHRRCPT